MDDVVSSKLHICSKIQISKLGMMMQKGDDSDENFVSKSREYRN